MSGDVGFVGRGGLKLAHALEVFGLSPQGLHCADFGCNVGGFTECLLRRGARSVTAVDTAYGVLDYRLRIDPSVRVMERTNLLHADPPPDLPLRDLIAIDVGWTPQRRILPVAMRWLSSSPEARIVTLIKPHYELAALDEARRAAAAPDLPAPVRGRGPRRDHVLSEEVAAAVVATVLEEIAALGLRCLGVTASPIAGGASRHTVGNVESLALLARNE